jgi:hypothetical protein
VPTIDQVASAMRDQPWGVSESEGRLLFDLILREKPERILELGLRHWDISLLPWPQHYPS